MNNIENLKDLIIYQSQNNENISVEVLYNEEDFWLTQKSMAKPFEAVYIFDIYDEDTQIVAKGTITIFKAQCTSGLKLDMQHQTAFAPEFSFSARDAKRADKKLWDFTVEEVKKK